MALCWRAVGPSCHVFCTNSLIPRAALAPNACWRPCCTGQLPFLICCSCVAAACRPLPRSHTPHRAPSFCNTLCALLGPSRAAWAHARPCKGFAKVVLDWVRRPTSLYLSLRVCTPSVLEACVLCAFLGPGVLLHRLGACFCLAQHTHCCACLEACVSRCGPDCACVCLHCGLCPRTTALLLVRTLAKRVPCQVSRACVC